jgi:cell volume regulation protein A
MDIQQLIRDLPLEHLLLGLSSLLLLSVFASKASGRLGVPALLLFLFIGMLAGSEGPGGIGFDYPRLAQSLGVVALSLILFSGGLDTRWHTIRPVLAQGLALATLGVCLTAGLIAWFAAVVLKFSWLEGMLLGAIVSSTDAAAVFSVLRSRQARLRGQLTSLLELESGINDPMSIFLTLGLITLLTHPSTSPFVLIPMFLQEMLLGALLGYSIGALMIVLIERIKLEYEGLYTVLTLALALLSYALTASVGGNGFLAVYVTGLVVGSSWVSHKEHLIRFHNGQAWLMQIVMFLTFGLQVFPSKILPIVGVGIILSLFLIFVARPGSVFATLLPTRMTVKEKLFVSWVGLRGAAPIVLATFPVIAGVPKADMMFHLVFFIVLTSVLLQGTSLSLVARWLGLSVPLSSTPRQSSEQDREIA